MLAWDPTQRSAAAKSLPNDNESRKWSELTWKERFSLLHAKFGSNASVEQERMRMLAEFEDSQRRARENAEVEKEIAELRAAESTNSWHTAEAAAARCAKEAVALLAATKSGSYPGNPRSGQRDDPLYNLTRCGNDCLFRPAEHWDRTTGGQHSMRQDVRRYIYKHETFGEGYVIEVLTHGQQEDYHGGQGGGATTSRLLLETEVAQLESIGSLANKFFGA